MEVKGRDKDFPICVVGNMIDETESRQLSFEEGRELAERLGCAFEEWSAKDGTNVEKIVFDIVRVVRWKRAKEKLRQEDNRKRDDERGSRGRRRREKEIASGGRFSAGRRSGCFKTNQ
jgi:Fe2+ transport system protein B